MTHASTVGMGHEATDLLRALFISQSISHPAHEAGEALCHFPGRTPPLITKGLSLVGIVAIERGVTAQLATDGTVVNAQRSGDLPLAHMNTLLGVNLVSLGLGQLSVSHALLHFGRIWSPTRLQAWNMMVERYDCTRISGLYDDASGIGP
nr:hypothetical protein [Chromohalobacter salexigens]